VIVHHIEMDDVGTGGNDIFDFIAQASEVGRQDAGGDKVVAHWLDPRFLRRILLAGATSSACKHP
jgi:hypothetical protein